ncbi:MAG TPA: DUF2721 domain-containing protein [Thermoanaerobaculia bacterium]
MHAPSLQQLIPVLQLAIGPVILISGIGLLMLSMTNRYGRTIDRARDLALKRRQGTTESIGSIDAQLRIIMRRAVIMRRAIALAAVSILLAAILIIVLFTTALVNVDVAWALAAIFIACLAALIASMINFIRDINESLSALKMEVGASF